MISCLLKTTAVLCMIYSVLSSPVAMAEAASSSVQDYPGITIQPAHGIFDAGTVDANVKGEFVVENQTGKELRIKKVRAGCGSCTKATWTEYPIANGGQAYVSFELLVDRVHSGKFSKYMYVSIDGYQKTVKLTITGELIGAQKHADSFGGLDLPRVFFGDVLPEEKWEKSLCLTMPAGAGALYTVDSVSVDHDRVEAVPVPRDGENEWAFRVFPRTPLPLGQIKTQLKIVMLNGETGRRRTYGCEVRGYVGLRLISYRTRVTFQRGHGEQEERVRLTLSRRQTFCVNELRAETDREDVHVRFTNDGPNVYAILALGDEVPDAEYEGRVKITYPGSDGVALAYRVR